MYSVSAKGSVWSASTSSRSIRQTHLTETDNSPRECLNILPRTSKCVNQRPPCARRPTDRHRLAFDVSYKTNASKAVEAAVSNFPVDVDWPNNPVSISLSVATLAPRPAAAADQCTSEGARVSTFCININCCFSCPFGCKSPVSSLLFHLDFTGLGKCRRMSSGGLLTVST